MIYYAHPCFRSAPETVARYIQRAGAVDQARDDIQRLRDWLLDVNEALPVEHEAAPGKAASPHIDARLRVIMPAHLAGGEERRGDVTEDERRKIYHLNAERMLKLKG